MPFFEVRARAWDVPDPAHYDAMLLTSANAVRHGGAGLAALHGLPVHAVGERTAAAAEEAGLNIASTGASDAQAALDAAGQAGHYRLLWLAGEEHRPLSPPATIEIDTRIVYASEAVELGNDAATVISDADAVALHSPRAAAVFAETADQMGIARSKLIVAAFSPTIGAAAGTGWRAIAVANAPTDSALLSALDRIDKAVRENNDRKDS